MLAIERLGKIYPNGVNALERFSAEIRLGESVAIIGGSGRGKWSPVRGRAGLRPATRGAAADALDGFARGELQDRLLDLWADTRRTLVLVTHDVDEAVVLADRVLVMRPRPGRLFEEISINLARPRDRNSPHFDNFKRRVLTALDRSLDRNVPDADPKSTAGEAMWW